MIELQDLMKKELLNEDLGRNPSFDAMQKRVHARYTAVIEAMNNLSDTRSIRCRTLRRSLRHACDRKVQLALSKSIWKVSLLKITPWSGPKITEAWKARLNHVANNEPADERFARVRNDECVAALEESLIVFKKEIDEVAAHINMVLAMQARGDPPVSTEMGVLLALSRSKIYTEETWKRCCKAIRYMTLEGTTRCDMGSRCIDFEAPDGSTCTRHAKLCQKHVSYRQRFESQ